MEQQIQMLEIRLRAWLGGLDEWPDFLSSLLFWIGLSVEPQQIFWSATQLGVAVVALIASVIIARITTPPIETRIRNLNLRAPALRACAVVLRRLQIIYFALFLWLGVTTIRALTWDSRSYFVTLLATLVTAWAFISILSRIIRNRAVARIVEFGGWVLVTLWLLGILPEAMQLLDSLAFEFNDYRISALTVLQGIIVLTALVWGAVFLSGVLDRQIRQVDDLTPTMQVLVGKIARFGLIVIAFMIGLYAVGIDFTALTLISGAVGVGLGFGLQKVVSNLVSGVILLLDKSIKPGDVISVGETFGWITALNARYVSVTMRDGREFLIPNEDLITQQVQNWSFQDPFVRLEIKFGVSYDSDPHLVKKIAVEAAKGHRRVIAEHKEYPVVCHITGFGDSSIDFVLRFFISDPAGGITNVRGDIFLALWDIFKEHDIKIPFPHREIIFPEAAQPAELPQKTAATRAKKPAARRSSSREGSKS